jgi:hypothetical protein
MRHRVAWSIFAYVSEKPANYIARVVYPEKGGSKVPTKHWHLHTDPIFLPAEQGSKF